MTIDQEFNCLGYFGFGSGVSNFRKMHGSFCNGCILRQACWEAHRARVKQKWPEVTALVDSFKGDRQKMSEFIKKNKTEPYSAVMLGNIQDGILVASGDKPKDRGDLTLSYPFK